MKSTDTTQKILVTISIPKDLFKRIEITRLKQGLRNRSKYLETILTKTFQEGAPNEQEQA